MFMSSFSCTFICVMALLNIYAVCGNDRIYNWEITKIEKPPGQLYVKLIEPNISGSRDLDDAIDVFIGSSTDKLDKHFVADKIHRVWLSDGEMKVLFECKEFDDPYHIGSAPLEFISNKELVQEYLDKVDHIPHIYTKNC